MLLPENCSVPDKKKNGGKADKYEKLQKLHDIKVISETHDDEAVREAARIVFMSLAEFSQNYENIDEAILDAIELLKLENYSKYVN